MGMRDAVADGTDSGLELPGLAERKGLVEAVDGRRMSGRLRSGGMRGSISGWPFEQGRDSDSWGRVRQVRYGTNRQARQAKARLTPTRYKVERWKLRERWKASLTSVDCSGQVGICRSNCFCRFCDRLVYELVGCNRRAAGE